MNFEWNGERRKNSFQNINDQRHNIRVESRKKCEQEWEKTVRMEMNVKRYEFSRNL